MSQYAWPIRDASAHRERECEVRLSTRISCAERRSHRLHSAALSEAENRTVYGKCNHAHGHGHNYKIAVAVRGAVHAATGMVVNLADLKAWMAAAIVEPLDHKNIDVDVPWFADRVSTTENLAIYCWQRMCEVMPDASLLYEVRIKETSKNTVIYRGD